MFSARYTSVSMGVALAGALLVGAGSAALAEPAVVVKSSASEFPVGSKVEDTDTITLENGESVTVLTNKGSRTMKGPGTFEVGAKPKSNRARFANFTRKRAASRSATGAVRAASEGVARPVNPNAYYVDVERSGAVCLYDLEAVRLWRPYNDGIQTYQVFDPQTEDSIDVTFDDGDSVAPLDPALLTLTEGIEYTVTGPEGASEAKVSFVSMTEEYKQPDRFADALVERGCMVQLETLAEKLGG
ncbi:MAG: hypothetical protein AAFY81_08815 [Pseudomonadota bacterium]